MEKIKKEKTQLFPEASKELEARSEQLYQELSERTKEISKDYLRITKTLPLFQRNHIIVRKGKNIDN